MSAGFDPYHKLLGIPPEEQPPNHYRLLGLSRKFEDDVEVIENCSNRVMQSLRQHQSGARGSEIAALLNEVSMARRTLLNPEKKAAYDDELRAAEAEATESIETPDSLIDLSGQDLLSKFKRRRNLIIPLAVTTVLGGAILFVYLAFNKTPVPVEKIAEQPSVEIPPSDNAKETAKSEETEPAPSTSKVASKTEPPKSGDRSDASTEPADQKKSLEIRQRRPGIELPLSQRGLETANLIALIDPVKDGSAGDWVKDDVGIASKSKQDSVLVLPFDAVPTALSVSLTIERLDNSAGELFIQMPTSSKPAIFGFDVGSPQYTGAYIDSENLESAPHATQEMQFPPKEPRHLRLETSGTKLDISREQDGETSVFHWEGDYRRLNNGPPDFPAVSKRIVLLTRGARFKIHSLKFKHGTESEFPDPPAQINGADLISLINPLRDAHRGDWGDTNHPLTAPATPFGRLQIPVTVPPEYDLSVNMEIPTDEAEVVLGLPTQESVLICNLSPKQFSVMGSQAKQWSSDTFPAKIPVQFDFRMRKNWITVLKAGKTLASIQFATLPKQKSDEFSLPWLAPDEKRRIFFGTTTSRYTIHGIGMAANSGPEVISTIRPPSSSATLVGADVTTPARTGFKRPEGSLTGSMDDAATPEQKVKAPTLVALNSATDLIKSQFKAELKEINSTKKPDDRLALAEKLKLTAADEPADSATRYVLLKMASDQIASAGDPKLALETIDELAQSFECDALKLKTEAVKTLVKSIKSADKISILLESIFTVAHQAAEMEKYTAAVELYGLAATTASRAKLRPATEEANDLKREMLEQQELFEKKEAARKALLSDPMDPAAHLVVGEYLSLVRRDWAAGLIELTMTADKELKGLAERDLAQPAMSAEQIQLGKDWLAYAQTGSPHSRAAYADRAVHWLTLATQNSQGLAQRQLQADVRNAVAVRDWDQPYAQLLDRLAKQIEQKRYEKTSAIGVSAIADVPFEELPDEPGILVGFDLRIKSTTITVNRKRIPGEIVEIIRPIFQTATGITPADHGAEQSTNRARVVRLTARQGYAVSGLQIELNGSISHLRVVFAKMTSKGLDLERKYRSEVLGSGASNPKTVKSFELDTRAAAIIGIIGKQTKASEERGPNRHIKEIGFITASP